jgi:hypothetical protein
MSRKYIKEGSEFRRLEQESGSEPRREEGEEQGLDEVKEDEEEEMMGFGMTSLYSERFKSSAKI